MHPMATPPELMVSASEVTKLSKLSVYRGGPPELPVRRPRPSSQISWRGTHWCVTDRGIESLDGCYFLDGLRLTDKDVIDLAGGGWDHPDDFADAWRAAVMIFPNGDVSPGRLGTVRLLVLNTNRTVGGLHK